MALSQSDLIDLLDAIRAGGDVDVVRRSVELGLQALIDTEATEVIGAEPHERTPARTAQRNGARGRLLSTKAGDVELRPGPVRPRDRGWATSGQHSNEKQQQRPMNNEK